MLAKARILLQLLRYFGPGWLMFRLGYSLRMRTGWLRQRSPAYKWEDRPLAYWLQEGIPTEPHAYADWRKANQPEFFFDDTFPGYEQFASQVTVIEADAILTGIWSYFTYQEVETGFPPDWHLNPKTNQRVLPNRHWTQISDFEAGDIKYIWEASRFSVVFTLVRAYAATQDTKYAAAFWALIEDWAKNNPPMLGPNWKCGQEATFRVMAWCFGLYAFAGQATPEQVAQLVAMIAAHGERIEQNIDYARSQNNNHGVSEGVGLWTIGLLFPELRNAVRWREHGRKVLQAEIVRQVFDDGSYVQYSLNYQRVMLHDALWALRLGERNSQRLDEAVYEKVHKSAVFLWQMMEQSSGHMPDTGPNDSALILPLNQEEPTDFRPVVQAAYYLDNKDLLFDFAYEDMYWLYGPEAIVQPKKAVAPQTNMSASVGGYYTLRTDDSWLMARCADYVARPHQADQLHVDLWWCGINIACDAGTYLYNGEPPWQNGLKATSVHNTVMVDAMDQMRPYSRFLWLDWATGTVEQHGHDYWRGRHDGYHRLLDPVTHRRAIQRMDGGWLVVDEVNGNAAHDFRLHWLLADFPYHLSGAALTLETTAGAYYVTTSQPGQIERASENSTRGWRSRYYGQREPALSLEVVKSSVNSVLFWTYLSPQQATIRQIDDTTIQIDDTQVQLGNERLISLHTTS